MENSPWPWPGGRRPYVSPRAAGSFIRGVRRVALKASPTAQDSSGSVPCRWSWKCSGRNHRGRGGWGEWEPRWPRRVTLIQMHGAEEQEGWSRDPHQQRAGGSRSGCRGVLPWVWCTEHRLGFSAVAGSGRPRKQDAGGTWKKEARGSGIVLAFVHCSKGNGGSQTGLGGQGGRGGGKGELSFELGPGKVSGTSLYSAET